MRGIIVGFGTIGVAHAHGYAQADGIEVVGVVDPSPLRRAVAERLFDLHAYPSVEDMLRHEEPNFLDICAPPYVHMSLAEVGLANGLHVLCEKPVFPSVSSVEFERLASRFGQQGAVFYPAHNYKFAPILRAMSGLCQASEFGDVLSARFRTLRSGHAIGAAEWHPHWRRDRRISGGGILADHGPHSIYLAMLLTGSTPRMVSCIGGQLNSDGHADTEDTVLLRLLADDGKRIDLDMSWAASARNSYYSVMGTRGMVEVENDDMMYTLNGRVSRSTLRSDFDDPSHRDWFATMFSDFAAVVAEPSRQWTLIAEAWTTAAVITAAYQSADARGQWIEVMPPPGWLVAHIGVAQGSALRRTDPISHAELSSN